MKAVSGDCVELRIEELAAGGDGVGRLDGFTVFVPQSAPGDRVRARLTRVKPRFARGALLEVLEPGPARREAPCPYYGSCGGCSWLHLDEREQRRARTEIALAALGRIGGLRELPEPEQLESPSVLGYRSRARVAWHRGRVGFRARGSHEVVDVERCAVLDPETQAALDELRRSRPRGSGEAELRGYAGEVSAGGRRYRLSQGSFFQVNRPLWDAWLERVLDACGRGQLAVELYSGAGFYTAGLVERFERVVAVERDARAAHDAAHNSGVQALDAAAEDWAPALAELGADLVLLNPPRGGCHTIVSEAIRNAAPSRVVYVSCDPATLARDVRAMGESFRVVRLVMIEAFPQTHHVELICVLDQLTPLRARP